MSRKINKISFEVETKFYQVLTDRITTNDFEQWLYKNEQFDKELPNNLYLDLISLNYSNKYVINELHELLDDYVQLYKFKKYEIMEYLQSIIKKDENCGNSILMTYELYCDGYSFLRKLGLEYGLCLIDDYDLSNFEKELKDKCYPHITEDAQNALTWFKNDKIIFRNEIDECCSNYVYDDFRNEAEILQGELTAVVNSKIVNSNQKKPSILTTVKNTVSNILKN